MANSILFQNLEKQTYARREAFNSLRTNLQFCGVDNKVIMFTSCTPDEGKSTVTMELARSLNDDGKKVVLWMQICVNPYSWEDTAFIPRRQCLASPITFPDRKKWMK